MPKVCILTDSTAQFPTPVFPGHELVNVIPLHIQINGQVHTDGKDIRAASLPASAVKAPIPRALPPTVEEFHQVYTNLGSRYNEIVTILLSSQLSETYQTALEAAETVKSPASIHIIDSQTTAVGLGVVVQKAAQEAARGGSSAWINRMVRGLLPRIYTVFCLQSLTYLIHSGYLDPAQAIVGEMLGIVPFFILENGRLAQIQKVRNQRHLVDLLHEFASEFGDLKHIAVVQGIPVMETEARNLRDRINGNFPAASYSEHNIGAALATIIGPRSFGMVAVENYTYS
jgi:DegV family protein with EDD domain